MYEGENKQAKLGVKLGLSVADWVVLAMNGENTANQLPPLDQCKSHLKDLIKTFVPKERILKQVRMFFFSFCFFASLC